MTNLDAVYQQIGRQVILDFASPSARQKKIPTCQKGWNCGYSCQSKDKKNCKSSIQGQPATYADWLSQQAPKSKASQEKDVAATSKKTEQVQSADVRREIEKQWSKDAEILQNAVNLADIENSTKTSAKRLLQANQMSESTFKPIVVTTIKNGLPVKQTFEDLDSYKQFAQKDFDEKKRSLFAARDKKTEDLIDVELSKANLEILQDIQSSMKQKGVLSGGVSINGSLAAAYTYKKKKDSLEVLYLAASPSNFIQGRDRVKGGGTTAIKQLIQESINQGKKGSLTLEALPTAESFYEKLGFEKKGRYMVLSPEASSKLLQS